MTGPFSVDERLEILRIELDTPEPRHFHHSDVAALVAEVDRLRGELQLAIAHDRQPYPTAHAYQQACAALEKQRRRADQAEAERNGARAAALREGAAALDAIAEHVEARTLAHYNGACGKGSCDMVRAAAETLREMADGQPAPVRTGGEQP